MSRQQRQPLQWVHEHWQRKPDYVPVRVLIRRYYDLLQGLHQGIQTGRLPDGHWIDTSEQWVLKRDIQVAELRIRQLAALPMTAIVHNRPVNRFPVVLGANHDL